MRLGVPQFMTNLRQGYWTIMYAPTPSLEGEVKGTDEQQ